MGVYVKGMEMPNNCYLCCFYNGLVCKATGKMFPMFSNVAIRREDCPLIEVSPHGRLGDLDKLEKMFADIDSAPYSCFDGAEPFYSAEDAAQIIRLAPTVIPAEEGA